MELPNISSPLVQLEASHAPLFPPTTQSSTQDPAGSFAKPVKRKQVKTACVNCNKVHKSCGDERPCQRCLSLGLQDSCVDIVRRKRRQVSDIQLLPSSSPAGLAIRPIAPQGIHPMGHAPNMQFSMQPNPISFIQSPLHHHPWGGAPNQIPAAAAAAAAGGFPPVNYPPFLPMQHQQQQFHQPSTSSSSTLQPVFPMHHHQQLNLNLNLHHASSPPPPQIPAFPPVHIPQGSPPQPQQFARPTPQSEPITTSPSLSTTSSRDSCSPTTPTSTEASPPDAPQQQEIQESHNPILIVKSEPGAEGDSGLHARLKMLEEELKQLRAEKERLFRASQNQSQSAGGPLGVLKQQIESTSVLDMHRRSFQGLPFGVIVRKTTEDCVVLANSKFCQMIGYSEEELLSNTVRWYSYVSQSCWQQTRHALDHLQSLFFSSGQRSLTFDQHYVTKDGQLIQTTDFFTIIPDAQGAPEFLMISAMEKQPTMGLGASALVAPPAPLTTTTAVASGPAQSPPQPTLLSFL